MEKITKVPFDKTDRIKNVMRNTPEKPQPTSEFLDEETLLKLGEKVAEEWAETLRLLGE